MTTFDLPGTGNMNDRIKATLSGAYKNNSHTLAAGESTFPRNMIGTNGNTQTSGVLSLTFFTAAKTETIGSLRFISGAAAAATPTLLRAGIYSVDSADELTLVASTPSDTALLAVANTVYTKALSASWSKVAYQRYAFGFIVVTAATAPSLVGITNGVTAAGPELLEHPVVIARRTAQTDLPASITYASLQAVVTGYGQNYCAFVPA